MLKLGFELAKIRQHFIPLHYPRGKAPVVLIRDFVSNFLVSMSAKFGQSGLTKLW